MGWNERSDPDMRTANFCDVYREGVYRNIVVQDIMLPYPNKGLKSNVNCHIQIKILTCRLSAKF